MRNRFLALHAVAATCLIGACAADGGDAVTAETPRPDLLPLWGSAGYEGDDCSEEKQELVNESLRWGRIASNSSVFRQCIAESVNGAGALGVSNYRKCIGDPYYDSDAATQIRRAVAMSRSANDLAIKCDGVPGPGQSFIAFASLGNYGHEDAEGLTFNRDWLTSIADNLGSPLCSTVPAGTPCRWAAHPWPYPDIASRIWHEAAHTHGYTHGANGQDDAIKNCGYEGDATWHYQVNTMPYIIGQCIGAVLGRSNDVCGDPAQGCGADALRIVAGVGSTACECVGDPKVEVFNYRVFNGHFNSALHETGASFEFALAENGDLFAISKSGTGSGSTEVHVLSAESGYEQFSLHAATALAETGANVEFALAPNRDLYAIIKNGTGSGSTEVHVLSAASNYGEFALHTGTALHETGDNFEFELAGNGDLYAIAKNGTGSGTTEVHVLSAASGYQEFSMHTATALHETGSTFKFLLAGNGDLLALSKSGTGSGSTEVHALSAGSNYGSFALQTGTALHETGDTFDFVLAANRDIVALSKSGTGTGSTELHVLAH
jgi:hypothetical protein